MTVPKTPAQRQTKFRQQALKSGRNRLTVMLPTSSLSALGRLAKHRGQFKWQVLASLIDDAARQLPANERTVTR